MSGSARHLTDEQGFTLVELVVVMAIAVTLSAVAIVSVGGLTHRGKDVACDADIQTVSIAGDAFIALSAEGKPAASMNDLVRSGFLVASPGDVIYTPSATSFTAVGNSACVSTER